MDDNLMWSCDKDKMQKSVLHIHKYLSDQTYRYNLFVFFLNQIYNNKQCKGQWSIISTY